MPQDLKMEISSRLHLEAAIGPKTLGWQKNLWAAL
jgi:hypothetical protein